MLGTSDCFEKRKEEERFKCLITQRLQKDRMFLRLRN